jgi:hypothetical protein
LKNNSRAGATATVRRAHRSQWRSGKSCQISARFGQVVIALIITPKGFPLAYEVLPGNTSDKTTLRAFLGKIEKQYGKAGANSKPYGNGSVERIT